MVKMIPREMRAICGYIHEAAKESGMQTEPFIGGYFILRVLSPAIVSPEKFNLIGDNIVGSKQRRNLILLAKVLQV